MYSKELLNIFFWFWQCGHQLVPYITALFAERHFASSSYLLLTTALEEHPLMTNIENIIIVKKMIMVVVLIL